MTHRYPGEAHADIGTGAVDAERRLALCVVVACYQRNAVAQQDDFLEQGLQFTGFFAIVERRDDLDREHDLFQIGC